MAHHGTASIAHTPPRARLRVPALLDTNGRFSQNNKSCNSFKTNARSQNYSIQTNSLPPQSARHSNHALPPHVTLLHRTLIVTLDASPLITPAKINRQPSRLEILISPRKQTPATPINRQLSCTSAHALSATKFQPSNFARQPAIRPAGLSSAPNATAMDSLRIPQQLRKLRLGHSGNGVMETYTHTFTRNEREAAEKLGELFGAGWPEKSEANVISFPSPSQTKERLPDEAREAFVNQ